MVVLYPGLIMLPSADGGVLVALNTLVQASEIEENQFLLYMIVLYQCLHCLCC